MNKLPMQLSDRTTRFGDDSFTASVSRSRDSERARLRARMRRGSRGSMWSIAAAGDLKIERAPRDDNVHWPSEMKTLRENNGIQEVHAALRP